MADALVNATKKKSALPDASQMGRKSHTLHRKRDPKGYRTRQRLAAIARWKKYHLAHD